MNLKITIILRNLALFFFNHKTKIKKLVTLKHNKLQKQEKNTF